MIVADSVSVILKPERMPVLFIGHGSPMNAISTNDFTRSLKVLSSKIPTPKAILCISAHWLTDRSWVTHMSQPKTIHDFYGFPQALFDVQYAAPGSPELAEKIITTISDPKLLSDEDIWGLDHGTWSVLRHMYPKADIPVMQLSIFIQQSPEYHYRLGQQLRSLRDQGFLIIGSGNIVHNLRKIEWDSSKKPYDWALEFDEWSKEKLLAHDHKPLIHDFLKTSAGKLSVPTTDHYYPLLYALGASYPNDEISFEYEGIQNASISMRTVAFGLKR